MMRRPFSWGLFLILLFHRFALLNRFDQFLLFFRSHVLDRCQAGRQVAERFQTLRKGFEFGVDFDSRTAAQACEQMRLGVVSCGEGNGRRAVDLWQVEEKADRRGTVVYISIVSCGSISTLATCFGGLPRLGRGFNASLE